MCPGRIWIVGLGAVKCTNERSQLMSDELGKGKVW